MWQFLSQNWIGIVFVVGMLGMHLGGHRHSAGGHGTSGDGGAMSGCGGHGGADTDNRPNVEVGPEPRVGQAAGEGSPARQEGSSTPWIAGSPVPGDAPGTAPADRPAAVAASGTPNPTRDALEAGWDLGSRKVWRLEQRPALAQPEPTKPTEPEPTQPEPGGPGAPLSPRSWRA